MIIKFWWKNCPLLRIIYNYKILFYNNSNKQFKHKQMFYYNSFFIHICIKNVPYLLSRSILQTIFRNEVPTVHEGRAQDL